MGSLLLPDLRVDSRRGLPPGKAGRVEPRETQLARLKTDVRSRGWPRVRREAWTAGGVSSGAPTPPACLGAELHPAPPPPSLRKRHPSTVTASIQRPLLLSTPATERVPRAPYERPCRLEPRPERSETRV